MRRLMMVVTLSFATVAGAANAQGPVELELRGGVAIPTADMGPAALNPGGGGELNIGYRFMPHLVAYAGWDWFRVTTDTPFQGGDYDVENTGYAFGLRFQHPLLNGADYWVRAGGMYNHIELEDVNGDIVSDSGHELGWEAGGGLRVLVGERLALTPGLRYRTLSADVRLGAATVPVDLSYIVAEVGIQFSFGSRTSAAALVR